MRTRVVAITRMYCRRWNVEDVLVIVWQDGTPECLEGEICPYRKDEDKPECPYYGGG